eukprot:CAMPEP_0206506422 /NCGR_PEP_ID=MMETSP0324_2-20121206/56758_1 /ASSEMBLY_ACC=CAM_ASM_000836 /TAXON_ID=2866 /ORGANISM="Crypthecodinium cohnii, Strain Seligo" /LENGTH=75 /DNA_ID=CAMNT_0053996153 /DNA_START=14 /DNA_END=238 /DNA_ORIENTATION=+
MMKQRNGAEAIPIFNLPEQSDIFEHGDPNQEDAAESKNATNSIKVSKQVGQAKKKVQKMQLNNKNSNNTQTHTHT